MLAIGRSEVRPSTESHLRSASAVALGGRYRLVAHIWFKSDNPYNIHTNGLYMFDVVLSQQYRRDAKALYDRLQRVLHC